MYPPALMHAPFDLVRNMMSTQRSKSKLAGSSSVKVSWVHRFAAAMPDVMVAHADNTFRLVHAASSVRDVTPP